MRFMIRASRAIIPYLLERWLGLDGDTARRIGHVLSQGGEFAFILFAVGVIQGMIGEPLVRCSTTTESMCSRSITRRCRAALSACASRRRRCIAMRRSPISSPRSKSCGPPARSARANMCGLLLFDCQRAALHPLLDTERRRRLS
jgi:Kef-type K+ transport system membrane component KefB